MKKIIFPLLLIYSSVSMSSEPEPMMLPANGQCNEFYNLVEGVCVHATAMSSDANKMKARIQEFKRTGKVTKPDTVSIKPVKNEDPLCTKYKSRLEKYLSEGVMGIDQSTGKLQKMTDAQAEDTIKDTRENIEILCQ